MDTNDRSILLLVMTGHALVHTYELTIPVLMVIWLVEFGITEATLGTIVAVGYGLFGVGALPTGLLADRYGSQRLIAICLVGMGLSFVLLSVAPGPALIAVAICCWGAAASVYHPAGLSLISTGIKDSGTGFAYHGMAGNAGIALGPLLAVVLLSVTGWRTVALILAIPSLLVVGFLLKVDIDEMAASEETRTDADSRENGVRSLAQFQSATRQLFLGGFALVMLIIMFNGLYYRGVLTFLPELLSDFVAGNPLDVDGVAKEQLNVSELIYVALLMVGIVGQYVGGKATDRITVEYGLIGGYAALFGIALLFIPAAAAGFEALVVISLVLGFVLFMLQPIYQFTVAKYTPADARGLSYGYVYLAQFGVGAFGAAIVGVILTYSVTSTVFLTLAGFSFVAVAFSVLLWKSF